MLEGLNILIHHNKGKKIAIITHATAITFLLKKWCDIKYESYYKFNNQVFFDGKWQYLQTFKLEFDDNNVLLKITKII